MTICEKCKNKVCLETGCPCEEVEKLLPQMTDGLVPLFEDICQDTYHHKCGCNDCREIRALHRKHPPYLYVFDTQYIDRNFSDEDVT